MTLYTIVQAFCWCLFHSLWLGCLIAGGACSLIAIGRPSARTARAVLLLALFTFALLLLCKLAVELGKAPVGVGETALLLGGDGSFTRSSTFIHRFNQLAGILFGTWLCVAAFRLKRLAAAYFRLHSIIQTATPYVFPEAAGRPVPRCRERNTRLLQSPQVSGPVQAGHRRPVILLPEAGLDGFSPAELRAILAHELAHVHHYDYLLNLFQEVVKALFFFNPAVALLCRLLNREREFLCDEAALREVPDKALYAGALVKVYTWSLGWAGLPLRFSGSEDTITLRLQKMAGAFRRPLPLGALLVLAGVWMLAYGVDPGFRSYPSTAAALWMQALFFP